MIQEILAQLTVPTRHQHPGYLTVRIQHRRRVQQPVRIHHQNPVHPTAQMSHLHRILLTALRLPVLQTAHPAVQKPLLIIIIITAVPAAVTQRKPDQFRRRLQWLQQPVPVRPPLHRAVLRRMHLRHSLTVLCRQQLLIIRKMLQIPQRAKAQMIRMQ